MKILYYDCFSGISGDMNLAALIDLGVEQSYLINELNKLNIDGYSLRITSDQRRGIKGTRVDVLLADNNDKANQPFTFEGLKSLASKQAQPHAHDQPHGRNYADIRLLINNSGLNDNVKRISLAIFKKVAEAEAHVHGKPVDEVHFHEVGAVDSIVDIVGAGICIDYLKPDKIISSPVQLGGGMVKCAHGTFPVPAPATAEILIGIPVRLGAVQFETTTPTGAAILAALVNEFTDKPDLNISKIAYGIGHRDTEIPNVLRVFMAEWQEAYTTDYLHASATMIECNIDDMNPEMFEYIMDRLFEAGAEDVYFQSIIMKKSRPATKISILCPASIVNTAEHILLHETSTLGLRKYEVHKTMLKRNHRTIETKWGPVNIKLGLVNEQVIKTKPEYEDCLRISKENKIPIRIVYQEIATLLDSQNQ